MKRILYVILGSILVACLSQAVATADQAGSSSSGISKPAQVYYPGDVVHIIAEAPIDTDSLTAVMPDGQELTMIYDRRNKIWQNYWQVPMGFRKGAYTAKLSAVDVEGRSFEGETSPIYVDEPTLPVVLRLAPSEEAKPAQVAAPPKENKPVQVTAPARVKAKETVRAAKPTVKTKRKVAAQPVKPKEDIDVSRLRYITAARDFLAQQEYEKAKTQLEALLKIDPENTDVKLMLTRIEAIIKARKTTL